MMILTWKIMSGMFGAKKGGPSKIVGLVGLVQPDQPDQLFFLVFFDSIDGLQSIGMRLEGR